MGNSNSTQGKEGGPVRRTQSAQAPANRGAPEGKHVTFVPKYEFMSQRPPSATPSYRPQQPPPSAQSLAPYTPYNTRQTPQSVYRSHSASGPMRSTPSVGRSFSRERASRRNLTFQQPGFPRDEVVSRENSPRGGSGGNAWDKRLDRVIQQQSTPGGQGKREPARPSVVGPIPEIVSMRDIETAVELDKAQANEPVIKVEVKSQPESKLFSLLKAEWTGGEGDRPPASDPSPVAPAALTSHSAFLGTQTPVERLVREVGAPTTSTPVRSSPTRHGIGSAAWTGHASVMSRSSAVSSFGHLVPTPSRVSHDPPPPPRTQDLPPPPPPPQYYAAVGRQYPDHGSDITEPLPSPLPSHREYGLHSGAQRGPTHVPPQHHNHPVRHGRGRPRESPGCPVTTTPSLTSPSPAGRARPRPSPTRSTAPAPISFAGSPVSPGGGHWPESQPVQPALPHKQPRLTKPHSPQMPSSKVTRDAYKPPPPPFVPPDKPRWRSPLARDPTPEETRRRQASVSPPRGSRARQSSLGTRESAVHEPQSQYQAWKQSRRDIGVGDDKVVDSPTTPLPSPLPPPPPPPVELPPPPPVTPSVPSPDPPSLQYPGRSPSAGHAPLVPRVPIELIPGHHSTSTRDPPVRTRQVDQRDRAADDIHTDDRVPTVTHTVASAAPSSRHRTASPSIDDRPPWRSPLAKDRSSPVPKDTGYRDRRDMVPLSSTYKSRVSDAKPPRSPVRTAVRSVSPEPRSRSPFNPEDYYATVTHTPTHARRTPMQATRAPQQTPAERREVDDIVAIKRAHRLMTVSLDNTNRFDESDVPVIPLAPRTAESFALKQAFDEPVTDIAHFVKRVQNKTPNKRDLAARRVPIKKETVAALTAHGNISPSLLSPNARRKLRGHRGTIDQSSLHSPWDKSTRVGNSPPHRLPENMVEDDGPGLGHLPRAVRAASPSGSQSGYLDAGKR